MRWTFPLNKPPPLLHLNILIMHYINFPQQKKYFNNNNILKIIFIIDKHLNLVSLSRLQLRNKQDYVCLTRRREKSMCWLNLNLIGAHFYVDERTQYYCNNRPLLNVHRRIFSVVGERTNAAAALCVEMIVDGPRSLFFKVNYFRLESIRVDLTFKSPHPLQIGAGCFNSLFKKLASMKFEFDSCFMK